MKSLSLRYFYLALGIWHLLLAFFLWRGLAWVSVWFFLLLGIFLLTVKTKKNRLSLGLFCFLCFLTMGRVFWVQRLEAKVPTGVQTWEMQVRGELCEKKKTQWTCVFASPWGKLLYRNRQGPLFEVGSFYTMQAVFQKQEEPWAKARGLFIELEGLEYHKVREGPAPYSWRFKQAIQERLQGHLSPSAFALAVGLMYGDERFFSAYDKEAFQRSSLSHLVAISGYNVSLLIQVFYACLSFLHRRWRLFFAGVAVFVFCAFVGFQSSVVRACWMGILVLWANVSGKSSASFSLLLVTSLAMTFWQPYRLLYDIGFQLSFMACFGLLLKLPWEAKGKSSAWRDFFMTPVYASLYTTPVILYHFSNYYPLGIIANIVVSPVVSVAMFSSFFSLLFLPFTWLTQILLDWVLAMAMFFSSFSWAVLPVPQANFFAFMGFGLLFFGALWKYRLFLKLFFAPFYDKKFAKQRGFEV